jgi:hypothetical protein
VANRAIKNLIIYRAIIVALAKQALLSMAVFIIFRYIRYSYINLIFKEFYMVLLDI